MSDVLLGNSLAMLVAAHALARKGRSVILVSEGRPLGGHFGGLHLGDLLFDIGMVFMEFPDHGAVSSDLAAYNPRAPNSAARFSALVEEFSVSFEEHRGSQIRTPECLIEEGRVPDYMISNRTDAFFGSRDGPSAETLEAGRIHPAHASHKHEGHRFATLTYAEAAVQNHGEAFHARFFAPFAEKIIGDASARLLARFHRSAWLPLYHPETIAAATRHQSSVLPEYGFYMPGSGSVAAWTRKLAAACGSLPGVEIVESKVATCEARRQGYALTLQDGRTIEGDRLALGTTVERACFLAGQPMPARHDCASIHVAFFMVRQAAIQSPGSCVFVVDARLSAYRVTDIEACSCTDAAWHRVVVEAGVAAQMLLLDQVDRERELAALDQTLKEDLMVILNIAAPGDVRHLRSLTGRDAISIPGASSVVTVGASLDQLAASMPGVQLTGAALGMNAATMNDQIVQGLKLAEEWR